MRGKETNRRQGKRVKRIRLERQGRKVFCVNIRGADCLGRALFATFPPAATPLVSSTSSAKKKIRPFVFSFLLCFCSFKYFSSFVS